MAAVQCALCEQSFSAHAKYLRHFRKAHKDASSEAYMESRERAHWLKEHAKLPGILDATEAATVAPGQDRLHFACACGLHLLKRSAAKHFKSCDATKDISNDDIKNWVVLKDCWAIIGGWTMTHLESYFEALAVSSAQPTPIDDTQDASVDVPADSAHLQTLAAHDTRAAERHYDLRAPGVVSAPGVEQRRDHMASGIVSAPVARGTSGVASASSDANRTTILDSSATLQLALDRKAAEALERGDMQTFNDLYEKAARLRQQTLHTGAEAARLGAKAHEPAQSSTTHDSAIAMPSSVKIRQEGASWTSDSRDPNKRRSDVYVTLHGGGYTPDLGDVRKYLELRRKAEGTIEGYTQGMGFFFSLLEVEGECSLLGILVYLYEQGMIQEVFRLPLLNPEYPQTRKVVQSLLHLTASLSLECKRRRYVEAERVLGLIDSDVLHTLSILCNEEKEAAERGKEDFDSDMLDRIASLAEQKIASEEAMRDVQAMHWVENRDGSIDPRLEYAATVAMGFVLIANAPPSRPGEMSSITCETAVKFCQAQEGDDWMIHQVPQHITRTRKEHKTGKKRGESGKYIAPGTKECMTRFMDRPSYIADGYFLKPAHGKMKTVQMSTLLVRGCAVYTPTREPFTPTLRRKQFETLVWEDEDHSIATKTVADLNEHGPKMGEKIYRVRKAKSDAIKGRAMMKGVMDGPAEWPGEEDLTDDVADERVERLISVYTRRPKNDGAEKDGAPGATSDPVSEEPEELEEAHGEEGEQVDEEDEEFKEEQDEDGEEEEQEDDEEEEDGERQADEDGALGTISSMELWRHWRRGGTEALQELKETKRKRDGGIDRTLQQEKKKKRKEKHIKKEKGQRSPI